MEKSLHRNLTQRHLIFFFFVKDDVAYAFGLYKAVDTNEDGRVTAKEFQVIRREFQISYNVTQNFTPELICFAKGDGTSVAVLHLRI
jgi:hypothetical protein